MRRRRDWFIYGVALAASTLGHVALFGGLGSAAKSSPKEAPRSLEIAVVKPPPPPPPAPPPEEKPKPPPPKPKPKPVDLTKVKQPIEAPPPPNDTTPPPAEAPAEPPKPVFGISMSSTVGPGSGSGFSVRVGNTLMKDPEEEVTPPSEVKPYRAVPLYKVNKQPGKLGECVGEYPPNAKRLGIEGQVQLEVEVLDDGSVGEVRVVKGLGHGLDEAATAALKKCRFSPAEVGGQPVTTRITYRYTFVITD